MTLNDLGQLVLQSQDYESALKYFAESYSIALSLGDVYGIAFVGNILGQLLLAFEQKEEAKTVLQQVLAGYEKLQMPEDVERVQALLAQCE